MNITMDNYLRQKPAWMQLVIFGAMAFGIGILASIVGVFIVHLVTGLTIQEIGALQPKDFAKPEYGNVVKGLLLVQNIGFFFVPPLVFSYFADPKPLQFAGFKKPGRPIFIFLGVIIMSCSFLMVSWLSALNEQLVKHLFGKVAQEWIEKGEADANAMLTNLVNMSGPKDLLISILVVGVLPAICEELFFRGLLQRIFIQIFKNPWWGIVVTAAIFSAVHAQFLGFIPRWILGIVLGLLYWYSGSLWTSIAAHFIFNSLPIIMVYNKVADITEQKNGHDNSLNVLGIVTLVMVISLLGYLRKNSTTNYAKVYETDKNEFTDFPGR
jgi:membrane protease YdiL (CAAX protease family)